MRPYHERPGYVLKRAQHALRLAMDHDLAALGLTTPQYAALSALSRQPHTNAELARACFVTPQTMHRVTQTLEGAGLLHRASARGRGRSQQLQLTTRGKAVLKRAHNLVEAIEQRMVATAPPPDVEATVRTLNRAADALRQ